MIEYDASSTGLKILFQCKGSVFPSSFLVALPCAILCAGLKVVEQRGLLPSLLYENSILTDSAAYSGFNFLVGFIVVFRTNQAYSRFWEGVTTTNQMRAEWFDTASSLVSFTKASKEHDKILEFKHMLVRLFSLLHATAFAEIQGLDFTLEESGLPIIDPGGIDKVSLKAVLDEPQDCRCRLVFQWIQQMIVENIGTGVLCIAPPILSRAFQEFATGMVNFYDAKKIALVPFPFPYVQTTEALLLFHWLLAPLAIIMWVDHWAWAGVFCFIQVFILWSLNNIATEIEAPFGQDPNDLDGSAMQRHFNSHLLLLLHDHCSRTPSLSSEAKMDYPALEKSDRLSFTEMWRILESQSQDELMESVEQVAPSPQKASEEVPASPSGPTTSQTTPPTTPQITPQTSPQSEQMAAPRRSICKDWVEGLGPMV
eukprot:TRINITY_DN77882_c0_g1_i1.p1 TRINITY_DN77882_c0_g1~~TRINITY_DN77882_c0_g1_i1.p1  ORF type:complete len:426 (+),score=82.97 TRINITY_DN77882_c0_g1_i1:95-1372(+)